MLATVLQCFAYASSTPPTLKICSLCGREIPPALESRHHLVPKLKGGKTTADNIVVLHRPCHDKVHAVFSEAELARSYSSVDELLTHPEIHKFARWIAKRPIEFRDSTTSLRKRRQRRGKGGRMSIGLDAESDSVGPGIYGGRVAYANDGTIVIGQQYEDHNSLPGPVYAGGGYTELSSAIRTSPEAVRALLAAQPKLAFEISTGGATPLHVCGMSKVGQHSTALIIEARQRGGSADLDAVDTWGYTALQRHATNGLAEGARALLEAGADYRRPSGLLTTPDGLPDYKRAGSGDCARALALRLRAFGVLKVFQQHELALGMPLPDGEVEL